MRFKHGHTLVLRNQRLITVVTVAGGLLANTACNGLIGLNDPSLNTSVDGGAGGSGGKSGPQNTTGTSTTARSGSSSTGGNGGTNSVGGTSALGATTAIGGASSPGGTSSGVGTASTAGQTGAGGNNNIGGVSALGGTPSTGGAPTGGTGPAVVGGSAARAGSSSTGGVASSGVGGTQAAGGVAPTGGSPPATGGSTPADTTPPTATITPAANPNDKVVVTFSENISCATVTSSSFVVTDADTAATVAGALSCSGATASFTPTAPTYGFVLNANYSVKLTSGIKDLAGNALASAPKTALFKMRDGQWGSKTVIDATSNGNTPLVAISNTTGNAVVLWVRQGSTTEAAWAARWDTSASSWGAPESVQTTPGVSGTPMAVGADDNGNYLAVWRQGLTAPGFGTIEAVTASRFEAGNGWTTPTQLSTDNTLSVGVFSSQLSLAMLPSGDATLLWVQLPVAFNTGTNAGWGSRFSASSGSWSTAAMFDSNVQSCAVAMDSTGLAVGLYNYASGSNNMVATTWKPGQALSSGVAIESNSTGTPSLLGRIGVDGSGNFVALWVRPTTPNPSQILWNQRSPGASGSFTASAAALIDSGYGFSSPVSNDVGMPDLAVNYGGRAIAAWMEWANSVTQSAVEERQHVFGSSDSWNSDGALSTDALDFANTSSSYQYQDVNGDQRPRVALDYKGNAMAVWCDYLNVNCYRDRYVAVGTPSWSGPVALNSPSNGVGYPVVAMHPTGVALVAWSEAGYINVAWFR